MKAKVVFFLALLGAGLLASFVDGGDGLSYSVARTDRGAFRIVLRNDGPAPLRVGKFWPSCDCLAVACDREWPLVIGPGQSAVLRAHLTGHVGKNVRPGVHVALIGSGSSPHLFIPLP